MQALEVKSVINLQELEAFIPRKDVMKTLNSLIDERLIVIDEKISEKYKAKRGFLYQIERRIAGKCSAS